MTGRLTEEVRGLAGVFSGIMAGVVPGDGCGDSGR